MSENDLSAIISFLRSQPAAHDEVPPNEFTVIGNIVKSFAPAFKPRDAINPPKTAPAEDMTRARGHYLAHYVSNGVACHTPLDDTTFAPTGPEFSGGEVMGPSDAPDADQHVWFTTPNLTPMKGSAVLKYPGRATFIARFRVGGRHHAGSDAVGSLRAYERKRHRFAP